MVWVVSRARGTRPARCFSGEHSWVVEGIRGAPEDEGKEGVSSKRHSWRSGPVGSVVKDDTALVEGLHLHLLPDGRTLWWAAGDPVTHMTAHDR